MINGILNGLFSFVFTIISVILAPIDAVISSAFPSFSDILTSFGAFITQILGVIPWVLSWFHIPAFLLAFISLYLIAKLTTSLAIHEVKLLLAWYRKLMP